MKVKYLLVILLLILGGAGVFFMYPADTATNSKGGPVFLYEITGGTGKQGLKEPTFAVADRSGRVYVADSGNRRITLFDKKGKYLRDIVGPQSGKPLLYPYGIGLLDGSILVADPGSGAVHEYSQEGNFEKTWISPDQGCQPAQIFVTPENSIYITDMAGKQILVFDEKGTMVEQIKSKKVFLGSPQGLYVTSDGSVWVADGANYNVKLISPDGEIKSIFDGGPQVPLAIAKGLTVDSKGRVYVSDTLSNVIRVFDKNGNNLVSFGAEDGNKSRFKMPVGLYIDQDDNIFIADQGNNKIQVWEWK